MGKAITSLLFSTVLLSALCMAAQSTDARAIYLTAVNGETSPDVVKQLAKLEGPLAIKTLTGVLLTPTAAHENRLVALEELRKLGTPDAMDGVARVLTPHTSYEIRQKASEALLDRPCDQRCVYSILFYLYRYSAGEIALRERLSSAKDEVDTAQAQINDHLASILKKNAANTIQSLEAYYGLGTDDPSRSP